MAAAPRRLERLFGLVAVASRSLTGPAGLVAVASRSLTGPAGLVVAVPGRLARTFGPVLAGVALLIAGWLYVRYGSANLVRLASTDMRMHVDFETFWRSAVALHHHAELYRTGATLPNLDPPVLAVLLAPLAELDVLTAYRVFALLGVLLVAASVIAVAERTRPSPRWAMITAGALPFSSPLQGTAALGQVYGLLTAALTVAWLSERRERPGWNGAALGLAVAIKPTLLPVLAWPALRRDWRALRAALAAGTLATAIGLVAGGWSATLDWLRLLRAFQLTGFLDNDSLAALAVRFHQPSWLGYLAGAALLAVTLARARRRPEYTLWSLTAASLLLAPVAWNNYLVLLAPAVPVLLGQGRRRAAAPLLALPVIGIEWVLVLPAGDSALTRLGMSLYCGMLLTYWLVLTFVPPGTAGPGPYLSGPSGTSGQRNAKAAGKVGKPAPGAEKDRSDSETDAGEPAARARGAAAGERNAGELKPTPMERVPG